MRGRTKHTVESILARATEDGDCLIWQGYSQNKVPQMIDPENGKLMPVRRLLTRLLGKPADTGYYYVSICGNPMCVEPDHIERRTQAQHSGKMAEAPARNRKLRAKKLSVIARTKKAKLTQEQADAIRASDETCAALARQYSISPSVISCIRRGVAWKQYETNPFDQLMRLAA